MRRVSPPPWCPRLLFAGPVVSPDSSAGTLFRETTSANVHGIIFDIKRYAIHDGPGIRTTVFFKGCPLRCKWCQNPESQDTSPQLSLLPDRCIHCGACLEACPNTDDQRSGDPLVTDGIQCVRCGACVDACPSGARSMLGSEVSVEQLLTEIDKDGD